MRNLLPRLCAMLLFVLIISCEKESIIEETQIVNQENEKIFIDGIEHDFVFKENVLGEISLDKEEDIILTKFIEENENMSYYYDSKDVLYLFKNSNEMKEFMENNMKSNFTKTSSKPELSLEIVPNDTWAESSLKIYDGKDYQTLLFVSNLTYPGYGSGSSNVPDLSSVYLNGNFQDFNDKISSIKLSMIVPVPYYNDLDISYAILYREKNYGGYSLGISTTNGTEYGIADLHTKKMYTKWFNTRYWGDRASSLKHYY